MRAALVKAGIAFTNGGGTPGSGASLISGIGEPAVVRSGLMLLALTWVSPALAQQSPSAVPLVTTYQSEPKLELGERNFALPVVSYQAPDGTIKVSHGIVVGRDVAPNAKIGLGLFKMKPKYDEDSGLPTRAKSRKLAVGFSLRL